MGSSGQVSQSATRVTDPKEVGQECSLQPFTLFEALQGKDALCCRRRHREGVTEGLWELVALWLKLCTILAEGTAQEHSVVVFTGV